MNKRISVIIPNYNGASTARICLESIYKSNYKNFEVIVVDDYSSDDSLTIFSMYPCKIIRLHARFGAAYARNVGAKASHGEIIFFTDIDCVLSENTLGIVASHFPESEDDMQRTQDMIGGTYASHSYDKHFFSQFQSSFIHYSELKYPCTPDYIASHAMALRSKLFHRHAGFDDSLTLMEDVEFSHRLKSDGVNLHMDPRMEVRHIFNFSLFGSFKNAVRKTKYWTDYSLAHHDLLTDSGTASIELKINTLAFMVTVFVVATSAIMNQSMILLTILFVLLVNCTISYRFIIATYRAHGLLFLFPALLYYFYVYPIAIIIGGALGMTNYVMRPVLGRN